MQKCRLGWLLPLALIATQGAAYDHPLGSSAIRNAYFLGSSNSESVKFLSTYKQTLPAPNTGPYIAEMEVRTPFAQVVVSSREHSVGYSPMSARTGLQEKSRHNSGAHSNSLYGDLCHRLASRIPAFSLPRCVSHELRRRVLPRFSIPFPARREHQTEVFLRRAHLFSRRQRFDTVWGGRMVHIQHG